MSKAQTSTIKPIQTLTVLHKLFDTISNNRRALEAQMHQAAVSVLWHAFTHGDPRQADKLRDALLSDDGKDSSIRVNAFVAWMEKYGPVDFDAATKTFKHNKAKRDVKLYQAGIAVEFWKDTKEPAYKPLDMAAFISSALKRIAKDEEEMSKAGITVDHSAAKKALLAVQKELQAPVKPAQQPKQQKAPKSTPSAAVIASAQKPAQPTMQ